MTLGMDPRPQSDLEEEASPTSAGSPPPASVPARPEPWPTEGAGPDPQPAGPAGSVPPASVPADPDIGPTPSPPAVVEPRVPVAHLGLVGFVILVVGAWAGIVPFVGPLFGFSADGTSAWTWNLAHALLNLAPGGAAVLAGLWVLVAVRGLAYERRRPLLALAGLLALVSGAWLVVGPFTWPVLYGHEAFVASGWGLMLRQIGYALGPGLVVASLGAYCLGWSARPSAAGAARLSPAGTVRAGRGV